MTLREILKSEAMKQSGIASAIQALEDWQSCVEGMRSSDCGEFTDDQQELIVEKSRNLAMQLGVPRLLRFVEEMLLTPEKPSNSVLFPLLRAFVTENMILRKELRALQHPLGADSPFRVILEFNKGEETTKVVYVSSKGGSISCEDSVGTEPLKAVGDDAVIGVRRGPHTLTVRAVLDPTVRDIPNVPPPGDFTEWVAQGWITKKAEGEDEQG